MWHVRDDFSAARSDTFYVKILVCSFIKEYVDLLDAVRSLVGSQLLDQLWAMLDSKYAGTVL